MADGGETSTAAAAAAASIYGGEGARGGGGKMRRERKPPATPYARPTRGRWISRIVDPAKRLLSGSFSLFYPSPPSSNLDDEEQTEDEQENGDGEENCTVDFVAPVSSGGAGSSKDKGKLKLAISDDGRMDKKETCSDAAVPDIEQLIKGKTFSREDIDHLMKILHSKVDDVAEDGKITPKMTRPSTVEKGETSFERQKTSVDEEGVLNRFQLATSTPLVRPTMQYGIGASPVDIARAYMGSRTSDSGLTSHLVPKTEKNGFTSEFPSKPVMPSPCPKAPICWPGAVTHNQLDYSTPQRNHRSGLHSISRTPYSRTIFSKNKSKLTPVRGDNEGFPSISPSPFKPTATPAYGKSMNNEVDSSYGSGGPLRRVRTKFTSATPARKSTVLSTAERSPWSREPKMEFEPKKDFESGTSSYTNSKSVDSNAESPGSGVLNVHPHSSRLARQILEQLDRPITLKEKSKELKLAASWKDSSAVPFENVRSPSTAGEDVGVSKNVGVKLSDQTNGRNNFSSQETISTIAAAGNNIFGAATSQDIFSGANSGPSPAVELLNANRSTEQGVDNNLPKTSFLFGGPSKGAAITNNSAKSQPHNGQRKPNLPSIAIEKSGMKTSFASTTTPSFTFSFNTPSTATAEPPTPSIMPSFLTSAPPQSKVSANSSTFTSSNKITIAPPVIPLPSARSTVTPNDFSAPKFKFGSGKPRLSFAVVGDDGAFSSNDAAIPKFKFGSEKNRLNFGAIDSSDAVCC